MPVDFYENILKVFDLDEGLGAPGKEGIPYKDTKGYWTIGRGHLIGESLTDLKLSRHIIDELFKEDLAVAIREARLVVGSLLFDGLEPARQAALISMLYTLGRNKFLRFEETIDAIKRNDWQEVGRRVLASKWASDVDPRRRVGAGRDDRVAYMFTTGKFHPYYGVEE